MKQNNNDLNVGGQYRYDPQSINRAASQANIGNLNNLAAMNYQRNMSRQNQLLNKFDYFNTQYTNQMEDLRKKTRNVKDFDSLQQFNNDYVKFSHQQQLKNLKNVQRRGFSQNVFTEMSENNRNNDYFKDPIDELEEYGLNNLNKPLS